MRQGQQNRRGRGRSNQGNNQQRKGQNPLTRSFESNGPDVKLRGTPAHIAEKYMSLARDALSSGDPVLAENYLQHAEHYNRIIMAYREQQVSQGGDPGYAGGFNGQSNRTEGHFGSDMDSGEEGFDPGAEQPRVVEGGERRFEERGQRMQGDQPRHSHQGHRDRSFQQEGRGGYGERRDRPDRQERADRQDRFERSDRGEQRVDRERPDRERGDRDRPERFERQPAGNGGEPRPEGFASRRRERPAGDRLPQDASEQPEFLRRPVRRPRRDDQDVAAEGGPGPAVAATEETGSE